MMIVVDANTSSYVEDPSELNMNDVQNDKARIERFLRTWRMVWFLKALLPKLPRLLKLLQGQLRQLNKCSLAKKNVERRARQTRRI